mgnify:CR=1 FL=1
MRNANVSDLRRLGAIRMMPEAQPQSQYPETAQPQNDMVIDMGEAKRCYSPEMRQPGFYFREAQNAN